MAHLLLRGQYISITELVKEGLLTPKEAAEEFEAAIQALLQSMAMRFTTQEELIQQQTAMMGRAVSTPDFLLEDGQQTLIVNGYPVQWLEAKNFYGS